MASLRGGVCLVTGASGAIGRATAAALAARGATVVMACRNRLRGEAARAEVQAAQPRGSAELFLVDLANPASVSRFAREFGGAFDALHVLVHSAALFVRERRVTPEGWELMFATNHLGPFLLTNLLLPRLRAGAPSRVVTVAAPSRTPLAFDDLQGERRFRPLRAFGATKTANLLFTYELARRTAGTGITANAVHPGIVRSRLLREAPAPIRWIATLLGRPPAQAAAAVAHVALAPELEGVTGRFFRGTRPAASSPYSRDPALQRRLWEVSERLLGLAPLPRPEP